MSTGIMKAPILRNLSEVSKLRKEYEKYKKELGMSYEGNITKFLNMLLQGRLFLNHKKIKSNEDLDSDKDIKHAKPA